MAPEIIAHVHLNQGGNGVGVEQRTNSRGRNHKAPRNVIPCLFRGPACYIKTIIGALMHHYFGFLYKTFFSFSLLLKQNVLIRHKMNFMNLLTIVFAHTHPSSVSSLEVDCKHKMNVYGGYISTSSWFSHAESKHNRVTCYLSDPCNLYTGLCGWNTEQMATVLLGEHGALLIRLSPWVYLSTITELKRCQHHPWGMMLCSCTDVRTLLQVAGSHAGRVVMDEQIPCGLQLTSPYYRLSF